MSITVDGTYTEAVLNKLCKSELNLIILSIEVNMYSHMSFLQYRYVFKFSDSPINILTFTYFPYAHDL